LIEAVKKAGTIESQAVADALHQGLQFPCPDGSAYMITRPDMRVDGFCVDAVSDSYLKQVKNKQVVILDHATPDETLEYVRRAYPPLPEGATPTIFKPM